MARIAVIGAGIAGLGAAHMLQTAGHAVIVLERAAAVGGRMLTRSEQGFTWEPGAQFMLTGYSLLRQLMRELDVAQSSTPIDSVSATLLPGNKLHYARVDSPTGPLGNPMLGLGAKMKMSKVLLAAQRYRDELSDFHHPERAASIDTESLRAWGDREIGRDAVDYVLSAPTSTFFFWRPEQTPWWIPISFVHMIAQSQVILPTGGMGAIPAALAKRLDVRLNATARRVEANPDGTVTVRLESSTGAEDLVADRAIISIPAPHALALLADPDAALGHARAEYLRAAHYARNATTAVAFNRIFETRAYGLGIPTALNHPLAAIGWEQFKGPDRAPPGTSLGVLMPTNAHSQAVWAQSDEAIAAELLAATDAIYPGSAKAAIFSRVHKWEHAMPLFPPGRARQLAAALAAGPPADATIFTCGDYWMGPSAEQALGTGYRAAGEALGSLGGR